MVLNTDQIATQYYKWLISMPFDIDEATYNSVSALLENPNAKTAKTAAKTSSSKLTTASALSRITPLAVWTSGLKDEGEVRRAVEAECSLTHSNDIVLDACYVYCLAIHNLLKN